jgi:acetyltransferase
MTVADAASKPSPLYRIHHYPATLIDRRALPDGTRLTLRPVLPQDALLLAGLIDRLSPQSRRNRFLGAVHLSIERVAQMVSVDYSRQMALVVTTGQGGQECVIADARFCIDGTGTGAEFALIVDDAWAGRGIGGWLIEALRQAAAQAGVQWLYGEVLASNLAMGALMQRCGFSCTPDADDERVQRVEALVTAGDSGGGAVRSRGWRRGLHWLLGSARVPGLA